MARSTTQINLRIPPDLRAALQKAATERGVSLTREINDRLLRSFAPEGAEDRNMFWSGGARAIAELVITAMQFAGQRALVNSTLSVEIAGWVNHPRAYKEAMKAAIETLKELEPSDDAAPSPAEKKRWSWVSENLGRLVAWDVIQEILTEGPGAMPPRLRERLQQQLSGGALLDRLKRNHPPEPRLSDEELNSGAKS